MNRILSTTIATLLAAGAAGTALAEQPVQDQSVNPASATNTPTSSAVDQARARGQSASLATPARDFTTFDTDKSGSLSSAELSYDTELTANFATLDENGDGVLSRAEFDGHLQLGQSDDDDTVEDEE